MKVYSKRSVVLAWFMAVCVLVANAVDTRPVYAESSSLVYLSNGKLVYTPYANEGQTNAVNVIPDFSNCGYMGGGVVLPDVPVKKTISPVEGDDRLNIQDAIDYVSGLTPDANGFRGAVYLNPGTYDVNGELYIKTSGVVLRGAGQGKDGTILKDTALTANDFLTVIGSSTTAWIETPGTRQRITTSYVPSGVKTFSIASTVGYSVGDPIIVLRTPNDQWITDLDMAQYGWTASSYAIGYERKITAINGNEITLDIPVVQAMEDKYGGGAVYKYTAPGRISQCGVEGLRLESVYADDTDENHGWTAIAMKYVEDSWVRDVTALYFGYSCVHMQDAVRRVTVQDCAMKDAKSQLTGGRRYSFCIEGKSSLNLVQRCYTDEGRHDCVTGSRVPGPNVFLDVYNTDTHADAGPHHRYATGILFDNINTGQLYVQNRKAMGSGHGWAGAQNIFYNSYATSAMKVESPLGAKNFGLGGDAASKTGAGYWEDFGTYITPRSLYLQQLKDRLGQEAVDRIASEQQKKGSVWGLLSLWAGEGKSPLVGGTIPVVDSQITPTTVNYTRNSGDLSIKVQLYSNQLTGVKEGTRSLTEGVDYVNNITTIILKSSYLSTLSLGKTTVVFSFSAGKDAVLTVNVNPENLALKKTSSASSIWSSSYIADKAFDGTTDTRWSSAKGVTANQWIAVDLGTGTKYNQVTITEPSKYQRISQYRLQYSEDGVTYTDIPGTEGTLLGENKVIPFEAVTSRYLRLFIDKASLEPTISEVAVYYMDRVPPVISGAPVTEPNAKGWYNSDVTVHFTAVDNESGIATVTPDVILSTEGAAQSVVGTAVDKVGNSASFTVKNINIDKTAPEITIQSPVAAAVYKTSDRLTVTFSVYDSLSGVGTETATLDGRPVANGAVIDLAAMAGSHSLQVTAKDNADNSAVKTVIFEVAINAVVDIDPNTLNLKSNGGSNSMTAYIEFPSGYGVVDINLSSVKMQVNGIAVDAQPSPSEIGDYDKDGNKDLMVKFDRQKVISALNGFNGNCTILINGKLKDGRNFTGSDTIRVIH